jgi:lipoprotein-anchoring transpeptidase ErfK/SrfK
VTITTSSNTYIYSASILWAAYGTAIALSFLGVLPGFFAVLVNRGSYTPKFSTFMRIAPTTYLSNPVRIADSHGRDPPSEHVDKIIVTFPGGEAPATATASQTVQYFYVGEDTGGVRQTVYQTGDEDPESLKHPDWRKSASCAYGDEGAGDMTYTGKYVGNEGWDLANGAYERSTVP